VQSLNFSKEKGYKVQQIKRCDWANQHNIFIPYHDNEWCVPLYEDQKLFEYLILESMQAGLSWKLILDKRLALQARFDNFNPEVIAKYTDQKINALLIDPTIIRNKAKILATINNAKVYCDLHDKGLQFSDLLWNVIDGNPIINHWEKQSDVPSNTKLSDELAKLLKNYGFKFIGGTICYSLMQAVGMVNDHLVTCFRHGLNKKR